MTPFVPLTTGPVLDNPYVRAQGIDAIPSTPFEGQDWFGLTRDLFNASVRGQTEVEDATGSMENGRQIVKPAHELTSDDANAKFGIPGDNGLKFSNPINPDVAQSIYDQKRDELVRDDASRRSPASFWNQAERLGAGFVAGALDPLNIAASFVPAVGEARYGALLAEAGGIGGRTLIRAGVGAAQGVAGQAVLEPLRAGLAAEGHENYTLRDTLADLAFGGVLGAGLHAGGGAVADVLEGMFKKTAAASLAERDPVVADSAFKTSVAQMVDGRPIQVEPVFDAGLAREAGVAEPEDWEGIQAGMKDIDITKPPEKTNDIYNDASQAPNGADADRRDSSIAQALDDLRPKPMVEPATAEEPKAPAQAQGETQASPELTQIKSDNTDLMASIKSKLGEGEELKSAELESVGEKEQSAETMAKAYEQAASCLGMRG